MVFRKGGAKMRIRKLFVLVIVSAMLLVSVMSLKEPMRVLAEPPAPDTRLGIPIVGRYDGVLPDYTGCGGEIAPGINAQFEQRVVELINEIRSDNDLPPLKLAPDLVEAARYHATDMGQDDYFAHDTYDRGEPDPVWVCGAGDRIMSYYPGSSWGENIAYGYRTPQNLVNAWMDSPSHREAILISWFWETGVGYYAGSGSHQPYWVQDFGQRDVYPVVINLEQATTDSPNVSLYIYGDWAQMRLRNDNGAWTDWQPFQNTLDWTLIPVAGERTVEVEMRDFAQTAAKSTQATTSSDSITLTSACLDFAGQPGEVDVEDIEIVAADWHQPGSPYDFNGDGDVTVWEVMAVAAAWGPCQ